MPRAHAPCCPRALPQPLTQRRRSRAAALLRGAFALACVLLLGSCSTPAAQDGSKAHHRADGFHNNYVDAVPKGLLALARWRFEAWREERPRPPAAPTPQVAPELAFIAANAKAGSAMQPALTWLGHASLLLQIDGLNILTDPIFSQRASPFSFIGPKRAQPPGLALSQLPHIDAVLISHNHYDHLDEASVRALAAQPGGAPRFIVPLGLARWFADLGITQVSELDWWQSLRIGAAEVVLTPVQHWSGRGLFDRMHTLWGGYALLAPSLHLYFSGDTGWSKDFADTRAHFAARQAAAQGGGFDVALLAIGAYEPRWFMAAQHVDPQDAVKIHQDLGAKRSIGMHWGTFTLSDESLDEPPRALAAARAQAGLREEQFGVLAIGQTLRPAPRRAPANTDAQPATAPSATLPQPIPSRQP